MIVLDNPLQFIFLLLETSLVQNLSVVDGGLLVNTTAGWFNYFLSEAFLLGLLHQLLAKLFMVCLEGLRIHPYILKQAIVDSGVLGTSTDIKATVLGQFTALAIDLGREGQISVVAQIGCCRHQFL